MAAAISDRLYRPVMASGPSWKCCPDIALRRGLRLRDRREVLPAMLALFPRVISRGRARAGFGRGHIIGIALIALHKDHFTIEAIEIRHLLRRLPVVEIGDQLLYGFPALSGRE